MTILSRIVPPVKFPGGNTFLKGSRELSRDVVQDTVVEPIKPRRDDKKDRKKTASCSEIVAKAKRSRIPVNKKPENKYLEKIASSKGFQSVPSTAGVRKLTVKKPVEPGHMKKAALVKMVRQKLRAGGKLVEKGVNQAAGANVTEYAKSKAVGSKMKKAISESKSYDEKRKVLEKSLKGRPESEIKETLKTLDKHRTAQNITRGVLGAGAAAYAGGKLHGHVKKKSREREALNYYRNRGLV